MNSHIAKVGNSLNINLFRTTKKLFQQKYSALLLFLPMIFQTTNGMSEYPTYPTPAFYKTEKICKELLSDLATIQFNTIFHDEWVEKSDYLINQFIFFHDTVNNLVNNLDEIRFYLLEDIHYLIDLTKLLEESYLKTYPAETRHRTCTIIFSLLQESNSLIQNLLLINQEVIAS